MLIEQLLQRVQQRTAEYLRSQHADIVLSDDALADAECLKEAVQPADLEHPTPEESQRMEDASVTLGWLHALRFTAQLPPDPLPDHSILRSELARTVVFVTSCGWDLARAIAYLWRVHDSERIPEPLQNVLGAAAEAGRQAELGVSLNGHAGITGDPVALDTGIELLATAVAATPEDHHYHAARLANLGAAYWTRFRFTGAIADLNQAVDRFRRAVDTAPHDYHDLPVMLSGLNQAVDASRQAEVDKPEDRAGRARYLSNLVAAYRTRFQHGGDPADLDQTVNLGMQALDALPGDDLYLPGLLTNVANDHRIRFQHGGPATDLDQAIELGTRAVTAAPDDHPERPIIVFNLGESYWARFGRDGAVADLDRVVELDAQAVLYKDQPCWVEWSSRLGNAYRARFEHRGDPADLDQAVQTFREALAATHHHQPERAQVLLNLGGCYHLRYERFRDLADLQRLIELLREAVGLAPQDHLDQAGLRSYLDQAVEIFRQAIAATSEDDPRKAIGLFYLGEIYQSRFDHGRDPADLDQALDLGIQALDAALDDDPNLAGLLANVGNIYRSRFALSGLVDDLDQAIELGTRATAAADEHFERETVIYHLGVTYWVRFGHSGDMTDLDQAVETLGAAVAVAPHDSPHRTEWLSLLGNAYEMRYQRRGAVADLDQAIESFRKAVVYTPEDHPDRASRLYSLGSSYWRRYQHGGLMEDLDDAIDLSAQALDTTPNDHPRRTGYLASLANAHRTRYERNGHMSDLLQATALGTQAVDAIPEDHPDRAFYLSSLGSTYQTRYERSGVMADLDQAIELGTQAVAATPEDHPGRPGYLSTLGGAYRSRYQRHRDLTDLQHVIDVLREALNATPEDPVYLSNLGNTYLLRYNHEGSLADLEQAIALGGRTVDAVPNDDPHRPAYLSNLGIAYQARYRRDRDVADLDQAIDLGTQALAATPNDHLTRASLLSTLGDAYQTRLNADEQSVDQETLRMLVRQLASITTAPAADRVEANRVVGSLANAMGEHAVAAELFDAAIAVLQAVPPREAEWADQEHRLGRYLGLVEESVTAHCAINDPVGAVETAELGRGILLAAQLNSRSDLVDLDDTHPDLAAEFRRVRDQLNTPQIGGSTASDSPAADTVGRIDHRRRLLTKHDELLARIRHQPGFDRFLRPPRLADLQPATTGGAAVLVNTGRWHSDAIIITSDSDPVHIPLLDATHAAVHSRVEAFLWSIRGDGSTYAAFRQRLMMLSDILGWLWDAVVEPVLDALPSVADGTSALPRVWWLPTGQHMGLFPLHAAGHPGQPGALDAVVSSYTPTLRALAHARTRPAATVRSQLTVALQHTPGDWGDLSGTVDEARTLHDHQADGRLLLDEDATTDRVLAALPEATWAHFACHANADLTVPSQGGLILHDATLALPGISQLRLGHAELAYLSACSTAERGWQLADESLHLASAFQLAGFRHVIASLWPLTDRIAAGAAAAFYRRLPDTPTADHAATTLHHVIRELRTEYPDRPDLWAALIHNGP